MGSFWLASRQPQARQIELALLGVPDMRTECFPEIVSQWWSHATGVVKPAISRVG